MTLPKWNAKFNVTRPFNEWSDMQQIAGEHYKVFAEAEAFIAPFNAKQRAKPIYTPPNREVLRGSIRCGRMNELTYSALLASLVRFCETTKGNRALPTPHPSLIHSIQLPAGAFAFESTDNPNKTALLIPNADPVFIQGAKHLEKTKFIIVRPKLSKLGTASAVSWEVLLFNQNYGYIPEWVDSNMNPRWSGIL